MRNFNIYDIFQRNAGLFGNEVALVQDDQRITFSELLKKIDALSAGLAKHGVGKGDRIGILAYNNYKFFYMFGAAAALGAIAVPINWRLSNDEISYILKDSSPRAMVVDSNYTYKIGEMVSDMVPAGSIFCMESECQQAPGIDDLIKSGAATPCPMWMLILMIRSVLYIQRLWQGNREGLY